jgi:hypothetical protein
MTTKFAGIGRLAILVLFILPLLMAQGGITGAIFTTVYDGAAVNANLYESKCDVYLDGGPGPHAPAKAAGLPDGEYYFQVTDPSGKQLLSTDPVSNRSFRVSRGVIVAYTGHAGPVHPTGMDLDHPELGAITIRLANTSCPADFLDSPNGGGVYKVWVTPVADFIGSADLVDNPCGGACMHGFQPSRSKTDNFKAKAATATFCITVTKLLLLNGEAGGAPEWPIWITDPLHTDPSQYYTDDLGQLKVCALAPGAYTVTEDLNGTKQIGLTVNGVSFPPELIQPVYSFVWSPGMPEPVIVFTNESIMN